MNYTEQLREVYDKIRHLDAACEELRQHARELGRDRVYLCKHQFIPAPKGYEHEGGTCSQCGLNEVHYAHQGRQYHVDVDITLAGQFDSLAKQCLVGAYTKDNIFRLAQGLERQCNNGSAKITRSSFETQEWACGSIHTHIYRIEMVSGNVYRCTYII